MLRSTRLWVGITLAHCRVVQIRSGPEVIFRASVFPESVQSHAGEAIVEMSSTREMSLPATGRGTEGVIATSLSAHGPDGIATGLAVTVDCALWLWCRARPVRLPVGPALCDDEVSATGVARSGPEEPSLLPPSKRVMPTTSSSAVPSTSSRRTQYTRAGSRPRVVPVMPATLVSVPVRTRLPHRVSGLLRSPT